MIMSDGYSIQENLKRNELVIVLPQDRRKEKLSDVEQAIILTIAKSIYQGMVEV